MRATGTGCPAIGCSPSPRWALWFSENPFEDSIHLFSGRYDTTEGQTGVISPGNASEAADGTGGTANGTGKMVGQTGSGNMEITVDNDILESVGRNVSEVVGKNMDVSIKDHYAISVGKTFVLDAGDQITLKCGQTMITMDKAGPISVNGNVANVTMNDLIKMLANIVKVN